jgi:hypothetical protein
MNSLYFWKSWNSPYKQIYLFLLSLLTILLVFLAYASVSEMGYVIKWDVNTELEPVKVVVDQFARNLFNFTVESDSYYALDKFVATPAQVNLPFAYLFLAIIIIGVVFILTTFSYLDLYWFMAGILGFLFFLFSMKIEMLELFGRVDSVPMIGIFLVFGAASFIFNSYYKSASYFLRLSVFLVITLLTAGVIYKFSTVSAPFLYLANFGSLFPVWVAIIFVLIIGYDIIKGFLYVVSGTNTAGSKNAVLNFVFASLLYLANVFLLLMKKLRIFDLDIIYINPFLLLAISAVLGIWMFRKRTEMFSTVLPFVPAGAFVYISIAIISFSGIGYALVNDNIGMIEVYERIIIYGHLFLGTVFLIYVLINFLTMFDKKVSIYDEVYKPAKLTFLVVPSIAITMSAFFFFYQKKYPYHLALSGYYSYAGDVMTYEGQYPLAFQYYRTAVGYDYPNYRANYSIASLCSYLEDKETAKGYYENALFRDPTVQSYIGLSNAYMETNELFKALFTIQEGLKKFPEEGRLYNNMAVLYHKTHMADSAIHYFLKSREILDEKQVASSNILYLLGKKNLIEEADSIIQTENYPDHISFLNNKLAIYNLLGKKSPAPFDKSIIKDTVLNANTYAYLVNFNINLIKDTAVELTEMIDTLRKGKSNEPYKNSLTCQLALKKYYSENRFEAIQDLLLLKMTSPQSFEYPTLLGAWMLEQENYELSSAFYKTALEQGKRDIEINYAFATIMAGKKEDALFVLSQLKDETGLYANMIELIRIKEIDKAILLEETKRLQWFLYNISVLSPEAAQKMYSTFTNPRIKVYAGSAFCRYYLERNNVQAANEIFTGIQEIGDLNPYAEGERNYTFLWLKTAMKETDVLSEKSRTLSLNSDKEIFRYFFMASASADKGDTTKASIYYFKALQGAPYAEKIVSPSIAYLSLHGQQEIAYNYLVEIVQNNPSVAMRKTYLELCLDMWLISYAESTLNDLKGEISNIEYTNYQNRLLAIQNQ